MAIIHPFKAIRPTRDKAQLVSTRPLAAYRKHVLRAKLDENPYTFLHVIHPEGDDENLSKANTVERFEAVKASYENFIQRGILVQDSEPSFYIYRQTKGTHIYTGVIAGVSIDDYDQNRIKKHEATITSREAMFTNYIDVTRFNVEPVLLAHKHIPELDSYLEQITKERPEYEFSTTDEIKHELWIVNVKTDSRLIHLFEEVQEMYIADGHHRTASSSRLRELQRKRNLPTAINQDFFLAYLIDEKKLEILEFQRLVKSLNGLSSSDFLEACKTHFEIQQITELRKPLVSHEIICLLDHQIYSMQVKNEIIQTSTTVEKLDAQLLTDYILDPILGITDLKTSKEIEFVPGNVALDKIHKSILSGEFAVGFLLYPSSIQEIMTVADQGGIMPPKSTWIEPKMRSGLMIYNINE